MDSTVLNMIVFGIIALFVVFIVYGLYGYAKYVFHANRRKLL